MRVHHASVVSICKLNHQQNMAAPATKDAWWTRMFDLASEQFGSQALYASNEFFAEASALLKPGRAIFIPDKYTSNGKWMDGWETARHAIFRRDGGDFCLIKLGLPGRILGVDIDTLHFTGNYVQQAAIDACTVQGDVPWWRLIEDDVQWTEIIPRSTLVGGHADAGHNFFSVDQALTKQTWTYIRFRVYPDGGVSRLRL
eukprot:TRINITY_DN4023_c0_g3_i4.p1 TRINITY_DN4023_c0_g3~~TRINITY_DN4023_c0_g3_i4.p1  ORF type:complete len:200 (-),score=42.18 TRINITY_DN4023_c0_g3_i4:644-1243(-)